MFLLCIVWALVWVLFATVGTLSLWILQEQPLSSLWDAFDEDPDVLEPTSGPTCAKLANPPHSANIYWAPTARQHMLTPPWICNMDITILIFSGILLFLSNEDTVAQKNIFLRWQNEAVTDLGAHQVSGYKLLLSWLSCVVPCDPVSNTYVYCFVFQEWRSKQRQLSWMEYLQTGVLRASEGLREGRPVLVDVHGPDSVQEQNLTMGRRESGLGQGLGF